MLELPISTSAFPKLFIELSLNFCQFLSQAKEGDFGFVLSIKLSGVGIDPKNGYEGIDEMAAMKSIAELSQRKNVKFC